MTEPIVQSIVVKGAVSDLYHMWANVENIPRFMEHVKSVTKIDDRLSHWIMHGPLGATVEWDAEITRLEENQRIAWKSKDDSEVKAIGQVVFNELGPNETEITVTLQYDPPSGTVGEVVAQLFSNPERQLAEDLLRFKEHIENTATRIHETQTSVKRGSPT